MDAVDAEKAVGNSRARVAASGHENVDQTILSVLSILNVLIILRILITLIILSKVAQQARHEAGTDILEGQRGTVEEFQRVDIVLHLDDRTVERQRVVHQFFQRVEVDVLAEEGAGHVVGDVAERHVLNVVEESLRQGVDTLGHVETAVFSQSLYHRFLQVSLGGLSVGAIVLHILILNS